MCTQVTTHFLYYGLGGRCCDNDLFIYFKGTGLESGLGYRVL